MLLPRDRRGLERDNHAASPAAAQPSLSAVLPSASQQLLLLPSEHLGAVRTLTRVQRQPRSGAVHPRAFHTSVSSLSKPARAGRCAKPPCPTPGHNQPKTWHQLSLGRKTSTRHPFSRPFTTAPPPRAGISPRCARSSPVLAAACPHSSRRARPALPPPTSPPRRGPACLAGASAVCCLPARAMAKPRPSPGRAGQRGPAREEGEGLRGRLLHGLLGFCSLLKPRSTGRTGRTRWGPVDHGGPLGTALCINSPSQVWGEGAFCSTPVFRNKL